jgi:dTDP-4-amino-4,6-dideoxygalactose transaminase
VISDTAQAPGALYKSSFAGTLADIGGYSLNYHKHVHTGEGGILVTNNPEFAERMQLIRNHAEAVVERKGVDNIVNMIGHNFRLGEVECAIGIEQLKKLKHLVKSRQSIASRLNKGLSELDGLSLPEVGLDRTHVYYVYAMQLNSDQVGVSRDIICQALNAEGLNVSNRYQNIHLLPAYQRKIAFGSHGFPWTSDICKREISYDKGICPVAERLNDESYLGLGLCSYEFEEPDVDLVIQAFHKVWRNLDDLRAVSENAV